MQKICTYGSVRGKQDINYSRYDILIQYKLEREGVSSLVYSTGIYDNRLLVKIVEGNKKYNMQKSIPYDGAKPMYLVDDIDNRDILKEIIINTCSSLFIKKGNKSKFIKGSD